MLAAGSVLDQKYKILSFIGNGGSGVVYKAEHMLMGRTVAIKMLSRDIGHDSTAFLRFQREARAASSLSHPNIVAAFDFGLAWGHQPFLVMDFLDGNDIDDLLSQYGPMTPDAFYFYMRQACSAIAHAHRKGIVHRDLKTSNIIILRNHHDDDSLKIVDFGVAKIVNDSRSMHITDSGLVVGSPCYMSPEQCRGGELDHRSDIYSLGCVIYKCLTGVVPFEGTNALSTLQLHMHQAPPRFAEVNRIQKIPAAFEKLTLKALAKRPEDRQQSMKELLDELTAAYHDAVQVISRPNIAAIRGDLANAVQPNRLSSHFHDSAFGRVKHRIGEQLATGEAVEKAAASFVHQPAAANRRMGIGDASTIVDFHHRTNLEKTNSALRFNIAIAVLAIIVGASVYSQYFNKQNSPSSGNADVFQSIADSAPGSSGESSNALTMNPQSVQNKLMLSNHEDARQPAASASAKDGSTSAKEIAAFGKEKSASAKEKSASAKEKSAFAKEKSASTKEKSPSAKEKSAFGKEKSPSERERATKHLTASEPKRKLSIQKIALKQSQSNSTVPATPPKRSLPAGRFASLDIPVGWTTEHNVNAYVLLQAQGDNQFLQLLRYPLSEREFEVHLAAFNTVLSGIGWRTNPLSTQNLGSYNGMYQRGVAGTGGYWRAFVVRGPTTTYLVKLISKSGTDSENEELFRRLVGSLVIRE